jgi:hypothetical protein
MTALAIGGSTTVQLWIIAAILVFAGVLAVVRRHVAGGIALLVAAVIIGPGVVFLLR